MPYTMSVYPDEKIKVPKVNDVFIVREVSETTDMHWGDCVFIRLEPVREPETRLRDDIQLTEKGGGG